MVFIKLVIVFATMLVLLLGFKRPLWLAALIANALAVLLYGIPLGKAAGLVYETAIAESTIELLVVMYMVSLLQLLMERKGALASAEEAMIRLFNNRRVNIMLSPVVMGMLPAPNAVLLSAPIVDAAAQDALDPKQKAYATSYLRHIPESILPLYSGILLALNVTGLSAAKFMLCMLPVAAMSFLMPYMTIRKVPRETGSPASTNKVGDIKQLAAALWPIMLLIVAVTFLGMIPGVHIRTSVATTALVALLFIVYRIPAANILPMAIKAFHAPVIFSMFFLMLFKDIMGEAGVIEALPGIFSGLPLPLFITYSLLMFVGGMLGLSQAIIAVVFPIAFASIPGAGIPLLMLLICFNHAATQLTPTHICLDIAVGYFKVEFVDLVVKTLPVTAVYVVFVTIYYMLLVGFA